MSWVANLMIQADRWDTHIVEALSLWLQNDAPRRGPTWDGRAAFGVGSLRSLTDPADNHWGGGKNPECELWAGALNHADLEALVAHITSLPWRCPGRVQIFLMDQEESYFRIYMMRDGAWRQYAPEPPADADEQHAW